MSEVNSLVNLVARTLPTTRTDYSSPPPGLFINDQTFSSAIQYEVARNANDINVVFHVPDVLEGTGSTIRAQPQSHLTLQASTHFVHDFTFQYLSRDTDVPFKKFYETVNDGFDNHTPDVIIEDIQGYTAVVEFATTRMCTESSLMKAFKTKIGKYSVACINRGRQRPTLLFCIVVSESLVVSNLNLTNDDVNELCYRFNAAVDVYSHLVLHDMVPEMSDSDTTVQGSEVETAFKDIRFRWDVTEEKFPPFSKQLYDSWQEPPDQDYIKKMLAHCTQQTIDELKREHLIDSTDTKTNKLDLNWLECTKKVNEYRTSFHKPRKMRGRLSHKSTIPFPGFMPMVSEYPSISVKEILKKPSNFPTTKNPTGRAWNEAILAIARGKVARMDEEQETEEKFLSGTITKDEEHSAKALRSSFHRVKLDLPNEVQVELAKLGVEGKKWKSDSGVVQNRAEKKKGFPLSTDVSDINKFVDSTKDGILEHERITMPPYLKAILQSDWDAITTHGFKDDELPVKKTVEGFFNSPLMLWCSMVSAIGMELALANKQHCKPGEYIIKKLRNFEVFLLIKPTKSNGPMFVSLAWHAKDVSNTYLTDYMVFKATQQVGDWCWTEFHSFKPSKISTLIRCTSTMNNLYWFWREQMDIKPWEKHPNSVLMESVSKMMKISLMVMLEDKAATEELCTNFRYTLLEGFVSDPCLPHPHKMIEKLPDVARTKLQVWLINKSLNLMQDIALRPYQPRGDRGRMVWENLRNPYTGEAVADPYRLVNLMYLGYLKNKDESPEKNGCPALVRKIVKMEAAHPGRYEYLGQKDPPLDDIKTHEYSVSFQKYVCDVALVHLKATWGPNIVQSMHMDVLNAFCGLSLDRVGTLKASSAFDESWYESDGSTPYHRKKVIENLEKFITPMNTHVHHILRQCLETVEDRGCMHIDIFKKNQHGGLREIYVLGPEERIVQLGLETIAKQVCRRFKSETLTNPDQKTRIPETHGKRARDSRKNKDVHLRFETVGTSDDLKTFNQTQHTTKLALTLIKFTPEVLHPFIIRACSLFMKKRIKMDDDLLQIIVNNSQMQTEDPVLEELHKAYRGNCIPPPRWAEAGKSYIKTETGMLQGILHFLSSLHHTTPQIWFQYHCYHVLSRVFGRHRTGVLVDVMQSSDDSAVLISYPWEDKEKGIQCRLLTAMLLHLKKKIGVFLGLYPSVKCTTHTLFFVEFNSEFFFHDDHIRPTIKWVIACDQVSEQEAIVARQEEMSNSLSSVLEGGGSLSLCSLCQVGQSVLHYMLLGASVSFLFDRFMGEASILKDPSMGYFLMDHPFGAGITGFKYNLWNQVRFGTLGAVYKLFMQTIKEDSIPEDKVRVYRSLETTSCGAMASSVVVRWGNRKKWFRLLEAMNVPDNWEELLDANPECCYRQAKTTEEVKLKVAEKLHAPGVSASLARGDHISKIVSSSVYILSRNVVCQGTSWMAPETSELRREPLLRMIMRQNAVSVTQRDQLTELEINTLFPMNKEYEHGKDILATYMSKEGQNVQGRRKTVQTRVVVFHREEAMRARPEDVLTDVWWGLRRSGLTLPALKEHFEQLQRVLPWLTKDPNESLRRSPFLHHHQLRNFLSRMEIQGREVRLVGAPLKRKLETNIATVVARNYFPQWELNLQYDPRAQSRAKLSEAMKHICYMLTVGPHTDERRQDLIERVLLDCEQIPIVGGAGKTRTNTLALLQKFMKNRGDAFQFNNEMRKANCGIIGGFTKPQALVERGGSLVYSGRGTWQGTVNGQFVQIEIDTFDGESQITEVITNSLEFARLHLGPFLRQWCKDMGVSNTKTYHDLQSPLIAHNCEIYSYGKGVPVKLSSHIGRQQQLSMRKMELKVEGTCISLVYNEDDSRKMRILAFHGRSTDVSKQNIGKIEDLLQGQKWVNGEPSNSWMLLKAMRWGTFNVLKDLYEEGQRIPGVDFERFRQLLCESALHNLRVKGYILHDAPPVRVSTTEATATISNLWNVDLTKTITETIDYIFGPPKPKKAQPALDADGQPVAGPSGIGHEGPAFRAEVESIPSWGEIMDMGSSSDDDYGWEPAAKREKRPEPERPAEPLEQKEGFFDMPDLDLTDVVDVDAFGEPPFEIMPQTLYCHTDLAKNILDNGVYSKLGTQDVYTLLSTGSCLKGNEKESRFLMWLLRREGQNINILSTPDVRSEDYDVGPDNADISQFG
uniref:RNA-directed RNA polymerase L n=1 Tax=Tacheng Tick Virus 2 TaxID=1608084 RepID=A0A4Y6GRQ2_9VIRU|nr:RNA-dependent RNA polymerase [Tacheng Tick Virus 2]